MGKGSKCLLKVGSMNVQLLSVNRTNVIGSWLYVSLMSCEFDFKKNRLNLVVTDHGREKSVTIELPGGISDCNQVITIMASCADDILNVKKAENEKGQRRKEQKRRRAQAVDETSQGDDDSPIPDATKSPDQAYIEQDTDTHTDTHTNIVTDADTKQDQGTTKQSSKTEAIPNDE